MAAVALAALLGVFGNSGPFARAEAAAGADLAVTYLRFSRVRTPHELVVEWVARDATTTVWFEQSYLNALEVTHIQPPPESAEAAPDRVYYSFRARELGASLQVRFTVEPARAGRIAGRIGIDEEREVALRQLIFP